MDKNNTEVENPDMQSDLDNSINLVLAYGLQEKKRKKKVETPVSENQVTEKLKKRKLEPPITIKKNKKEVRYAEASGLNDETAIKSKKKKKGEGDTEVHKKTSGKSKKVKEDVSYQEATKLNEEAVNKSKKAKKSKESIDLEDTLLTSIGEQGIVDNFPLEDLPNLIQNIELLLPTKEKLSCKTRLKKMDWDKVAFNGHTAAQCKKGWDNILKKQRHYRYMNEILVDVKEWLEKVQKTHSNYSDFPKKKPLSGYRLYFVEQQNHVFKDRPDLKIFDRSRLIADSYKQLSDNDKNKYNQLAAKKRALYEREVQEFYKKHPHLQKPPKKPVTPIALYVEDNLNKMRIGEEEAASKDELKSRWKLLSDDAKLVWIDKAVDLQINFLNDLERYKSMHPDYSTSIKHTLSKEEMHLLDKRTGKPDKPPTTAYKLFVKKCNKKYLSKVGDFTPKNRLNFCSQKWKQLTSNARQKYQNKLEALNAKFKIDNAAFLDSLPDYRRELEINNTPKKLRADSLDQLKMADMATPQYWEEMKDSENNTHLAYIFNNTLTELTGL